MTPRCEFRVDSKKIDLKNTCPSEQEGTEMDRRTLNRRRESQIGHDGSRAGVPAPEPYDSTRFAAGLLTLDLRLQLLKISSSS